MTTQYETLERLHVELAQVTEGVTAREMRCLRLLQRIWLKIHCDRSNETDAALMEESHDLITERLGLDNHIRWTRANEAWSDENS